MSDQHERRMANSQTISQVATGLLAGLGAFIAFALDKRSPSCSFVAAAGGAALALVGSIILGGRGIARIADPGPLFNLQAWTCLFGFSGIVVSLFLIGPVPADETIRTIASLSERLGAIEQRVQRVESQHTSALSSRDKPPSSQDAVPRQGNAEMAQPR